MTHFDCVCPSLLSRLLLILSLSLSLSASLPHGFQNRQVLRILLCSQISSCILSFLLHYVPFFFTGSRGVASSLSLFDLVSRVSSSTCTETLNQKRVLFPLHFRQTSRSSAKYKNMASSVVCPVEDAVQAFLDHLVDPMLPAKSSVRDNPTLQQQQSVAKQVHSVVLLYNYYHRKQHQELAFLSFYEFCKLAVVLKPTLLAHMKFMQNSGEAELIDVEKQLSSTEKKIMDACDICRCLDASKNVPNIEGWPISKVAVLLVDSKKNCFLLFSSITEGVWSVVEKDLEICSQTSEVTRGTRYTYKKKRVIRKPTKDEVHVDDASFLQVGYSAVKEAAGINQGDINLLEKYTVYSQSKEKEASRFYIMQCVDHEVIQVPIRDVINSLQGPLVKKSSNSWAVTTVVEYFHVLPYSDIISEWFSRETFANSLQDLRVAEKNIMDSSEGTGSYVSEGMSSGLDSKPSSNNIESPKLKENNRGCTHNLSDSLKAQDMDVDDSSVFPYESKEHCECIANTVQVGKDQEIVNPSVQNYSNGSASAVKFENVDSTRMLNTEGGINNVTACNKISTNTVSEKDTIEYSALATNHSNSKGLEKLQNLLASKENILSQTALTALVQKRNKLALQQRMIEDEIALCDKKIQTMLTGREDDLELKIDSIIEGCNDIFVRHQERTCQCLDYPCEVPSTKRKRLSEAVLTMQSPCQELDGVCHENNWILPTYRVSQSDGGFQANITLKGMDFECSSEGNLCFNPREARESAAAQMLTKLRSMANSAQ